MVDSPFIQAVDFFNTVVRLFKVSRIQRDGARSDANIPSLDTSDLYMVSESRNYTYDEQNFHLLTHATDLPVRLR